MSKRRKSGDWKAIAHARGQVLRRFPTSRGLSNIPKVNETGSAAYRRLQTRRGNSSVRTDSN